MIYEVWLTLRSNTYHVEADSEEEAFHKATDEAIDRGEWFYSVKPQEQEAQDG